MGAAGCLPAAFDFIARVAALVALALAFDAVRAALAAFLATVWRLACESSGGTLVFTPFSPKSSAPTRQSRS